MDGMDFNVVKVFSATKSRDREDLGERLTRWLRSRPEITIVGATVRLSSDSQYHCLSIVLFGREELAGSS